MKKLIYIISALFLFSSCSDTSIVDVIRAIPSSSNNGSRLTENPAFQSDLDWYHTFNADSSSYHKDFKLYPATNGVIVSIPVNKRISVIDRIEAFFTHNGESHNEFEVFNERLEGYKLFNDYNRLRNDFEDEVQFSNGEKIVALNLKTKVIRTLAQIEDDSCDESLDWSENSFLFARHISSPVLDSSVLYRKTFGNSEPEVILILEKDTINDRPRNLERVFQVDPNTIVVEVSFGAVYEEYDPLLLIIDSNGNTMAEINSLQRGRLVPRLYDDKYMVYLMGEKAIKFNVFTGEIKFEWDLGESDSVGKYILTKNELIYNGLNTVRQLKVNDETQWSRFFPNRIEGISLKENELALNIDNEVMILNEFGQTTFSEETPFLNRDYTVRTYYGAPLVFGDEIINCDTYARYKMTRR